MDKSTGFTVRNVEDNRVSLGKTSVDKTVGELIDELCQIPFDVMATQNEKNRRKRVVGLIDSKLGRPKVIHNNPKGKIGRPKKEVETPVVDDKEKGIEENKEE